MNEILTPERILELGDEWANVLLQNLPEEKLNELIESQYKGVFIEQGREEGIEQ